MGGSAFMSGTDPLFTPRIPAAVYHVKKAQVASLLRQLFVCVASPLDGPGKTDFGDIDFEVCLNRRLNFPPVNAHHSMPAEGGIFQAIATVLGAERLIQHSNLRGSLAIPWPYSDDPYLGCTVFSSGNGASGQGGETNVQGSKKARLRYLQVDLAVCPKLDQFQYDLFRHAHGDFWAIVGSMMRPAGLTLDDTALWLRIAAIEKENFKLSKIFLTADPTEILQFLGLADGKHWEEPFGTVHDMFEIAATEFSAADKKRTNTRTIYQKWVTEFLPQYREQRRSVLDGGAEALSSQVRIQAYERFPLVKAEHDSRLRAFMLEKCTNEGKRLVKSEVPTTHDDGRPVEVNLRGCAVSGLKRIIFEDDDSYGVDMAAVRAAVRTADGLYDLHGVRAFVRQHWLDVGWKHINKQQKRLKWRKRPVENLADPA